ncbi:5037_t:CDS:1, partial [Cetraspora pellucida]
DEDIEKIKQTLSEEQRKIIDIVMTKKKSIFFTGAGGCGKSYTLNFLIKLLYKEYGMSKIGVTSSTGLSALNINGMTLHKFASIGIMDKPFNEIIDNIKDKQYIYNRWLNTEILIIDEISMINAETFDFIDKVAHEIREEDEPFGGIQLVISGDFLQLPP